MDLEGYNAIRSTLYQEHIEAAVSPEPMPEEDVVYVTVKTNPRTVPADVLNALDKAELMCPVDGNVDDGKKWPEGPRLKPIIGWAGSITFKDMNNGY